MQSYKVDLILVIVVGCLLCLQSCTKQNSNLKTEYDKLEWGKRGDVPTIHEHYDWVCMDINTYVPKVK
jgi:hypothetical protein